MLRNFAFVVGYAVILVSSTVTLVAAADFGTPEEAKAMLERAVAAVKEDKAKALPGHRVPAHLVRAGFGLA